jgi:hypothetical protein
MNITANKSNKIKKIILARTLILSSDFYAIPLWKFNYDTLVSRPLRLELLKSAISQATK